MARNSASPLRSMVAVGLWLGAVALAQGMLGADLGAAPRGIEEEIERQLRCPPATQQDPPAPRRSSEPESIEPWELVGV